MAATATKRKVQDTLAVGRERLCALSRVHRPIEQLIRFTTTPDNIIVPDLANRLPGRGVWITATRDAVCGAITAKTFQRSLKQGCTVPGDLAERLEQLLQSRATQLLALANKAGCVVTGFAKVEAAVQREDIKALLHAKDGALDGALKLDRKFVAIKKARNETARIVDSFTIEQLSLALGRENVVHAALAKSGITGSFLSAADRFHHFGAGFDDGLTVKTRQVAKVDHG